MVMDLCFHRSFIFVVSQAAQCSWKQRGHSDAVDFSDGSNIVRSVRRRLHLREKDSSPSDVGLPFALVCLRILGCPICSVGLCHSWVAILPFDNGIT
jgi:hypothetical protein